MAVKNDIEIYRGQDKDIYFTLDDPDPDLTGWHIAFVVRPDYGVLPIEINHSTTLGGVTIISASEGIFRVRLTEQDTACLALGKHVYDVQRIDAGFRDPLSIGTFTLLDLVNRVACTG